MDNVKPFLTIREACNYTGLSQHFLRDGCMIALANTLECLRYDYFNHLLPYTISGGYI